jgi:UDP-N-acetylglucosamine 2-epimerase (non-hydrolysing)
MKNRVAIFETRPETITLAPMILQLGNNLNYHIFVCNTDPQKELSNQTIALFGICANFNLDGMLPNQSLAGSQARIMAGLCDLYANNHFDATIVHGDAITVFCGALFLLTIACW